MINRKQIIALMLLIPILLTSVLAGGCLCSKQGTVNETMVYDGLERSYNVHLPQSYTGTEKLPLVIVLHGGGGNPNNAERMTGMSDKADEEGFIAVYPAGTGKVPGILTWNGEFCCGGAMEDNVDDVGFIGALIDRMAMDYNIDTDRVYVTGISNGGIMSYRLAAELPDKIAAIAPVAGSMGGKAESQSPEIVFAPKAPVSVIAFHGLKDTRLPYEGGMPTKENTKGAYSYLSVSESISLWVKADNCTEPAQKTASQGGEVVVTTHGGGSNGTEVILYTMANCGHMWPGDRKGYFGGDDLYLNVSATDVMWDFFIEHPKMGR